MRIREIKAVHVRIPLRREVRHASHSRTKNETVLVRCELTDGTVGWGEGLPRPYVTGETIDSVKAQWEATDFRRQLDGPLASIEDAVTMLDALALHATEPDARDCFGNALRCAVELSVLDAVTSRLRVPLSEVAKVIVGTNGLYQPRKFVHYSGAITTSGSLKQVLRAAAFRWYGFRHCKVKVGAAGIDDAAALARIRKVIGPLVDLRIDANEAWTSQSLVDHMQRLSPFDISAVEQPLPHEQVGELSRLKPRLGIPIVLDESLCSLSDARRAVDERLCDLFNIRISKNGGFIPSLRLAAFARQHGLAAQLGCQVGETGILSAAGRHFACSIADLRYVEGSFDRLLVAEPLTNENLTFGRGGRAPRLNGPGLGVTIDEQAVDRVRVAEFAKPIAR